MEMVEEGNLVFLRPTFKRKILGITLKEQALGVYVARVKMGGDIKKGVANIGKRPTFNRDG